MTVRCTAPGRCTPPSGRVVVNLCATLGEEKPPPLKGISVRTLLAVLAVAAIVCGVLEIIAGAVTGGIGYILVGASFLLAGSWMVWMRGRE